MLNILDLVVLICGAFVILNSIRVGILRSLLDIAAFFFSIYIATRFCEFYASWVVQLRDPANSIYAVTFLVVWGAASAGLGLLIYFFQKLIKISFFPPVESGGGAILGIWKVLLYAAFILLLLLYLPVPKSVKDLADKSYARELSTPIFKKSYKLIAEQWKKFPLLEERYLKKEKAQEQDKDKTSTSSVESVKILLPKDTMPKLAIPSIPNIDELISSIESKVKSKK